MTYHYLSIHASSYGQVDDWLRLVSVGDGPLTLATSSQTLVLYLLMLRHEQLVRVSSLAMS